MQEKSVEHSAGGTMLAVKKKMLDMNKSMGLLSALRELRELRKHSNKAKGNLPIRYFHYVMVMIATQETSCFYKISFLQKELIHWTNY